MGEVRELYVTLSLNATDFDKHIRAANKQIKQAESEFRLAAAGAEGFEKTLKGLGKKAESLKKQLDQEQKIVGQYSGKLEDLNKRLEEETRQHERLAKQVDYETAERDRLKKKADEQLQTLKELTFAYGADSDAAKAAAEQLGTYRERLEKAEKTLADSEKALKKVKGAIYKTGNALTGTETALNNAQAEVKELEKELGNLESRFYRSGVAMQEWGKKISDAGAGMERVGDRLTKTVTTPILGLGAAAAKATIDFESAFAGVRKTVNATGEDAETFFSELSDGVIDMSKRLATGANDIAEVMAIAGQLDIANKELAGFTETIVRLGMSTDMAGEDAAASMARFANITGMAQGQFQNLGATLVYLGNNFATTESEIMNMAVRIAAAGTQVGLSQSSILGFAAALSSLGLEAEAGGSAFSKALKKIETAVATDSDALDDFAKVADLTKEAFKTLWEQNPAEAFQAFIVGLSKMDEAGIGAIATLEEIGITELRLSDTLLRTANATEMVAGAQEAANKAWKDGTALIEESDVRLQTTESRLTNVKNKLVAAGISFGETMTPEIERLVSGLEGAVDWFSNLDETTRRNLVNLGLWAAATGPALKGIGKIGTAVGGTVSAVGRFSEAIGKANAAFKATGSAATWFSTLLGPGGSVMLAISAAAAGIAGLIALYKKAEAEKPDFSIDASEIENYKIDVEALEAQIDVDTKVNVLGDILGLKSKFIGILNDGLPETQEIREGMQADVISAVGAVYDLIEESYEAKKLELDKLFESGVISEETYNTALATLNAQADTLKTDLETKAGAVSAYVTTLCQQNRAMTDEEITALNALLESLGATAEQVQNSVNAQMQAYALAYDKTKLGFGSEEDQKKAIEYIELKAKQEADRLKAEKEALDAMYAATTEGKTEEERIEAYKQLNEERAAIDRQLAEVEETRKREAAELTSGIVTDFDALIATIQEYNRLAAEYDKNSLGGGGEWYNWVEWNPQAITDALGITNYAGSMKKALEALDPYLKEGSPLMNFLATLQAQGIIPEGSLSSTEATLNTLINLAQYADNAAKAAEENKGALTETAQTAAEEADAAAKEKLNGEPTGEEYMAGVTSGIQKGLPGTIRAVKGAMSKIVATAKYTMDIHSPSGVMEREVGVQMMRGAGSGFLKELPKQEKLIANAMRHLTGEIRGAGAPGGNTDNRKTYNSEVSIPISGNTFILNDRQDIESLAIEIAALTTRKQNGKGMRVS